MQQDSYSGMSNSLFVTPSARLAPNQMSAVSKSASVQKMTPMAAVPKQAANLKVGQPQNGFLAKAAATFGSVADSIGQELNSMVGG